MKMLETDPGHDGMHWSVPTSERLNSEDSERRTANAT